MSQPSEDVSQLVAELDCVRKHGTTQLDNMKFDLKLLVAYATQCFPLMASKGRSALVRSLVDGVVDSEYIKGRYNDSERPGLRAWFGATGNANIDKGNAKEREKNAASYFCLSPQTFRHAERRKKRLDDIARAIENFVAEKALSEKSDVDFGWMGPSGPYVHRHQLEQQFLVLLRVHAPIIVLAGPPSVGKRTLARYMTNEHKPAGTMVLHIDGSNPQALQQSIYDGLIKAGVDPREINDVVPRYTLKAFLESDSAPRYVIVEEVSDSDLALFLAGEKSETTVVVTTTRRLSKIDKKYCIKVGELEPREAIELVEQLIPDTPEADAAALAEALGYHVLAITVVCGLVKQDDHATVASFCNGIERNAAALFDGETDGHPALTQLYRRVLANLAETDLQALRVLEMLVFLHGGSYIPSTFVALSLGDALGLTLASTSHLRAITSRALSVLKDRYLIDVHENDYLTIPKLTQTIISQLVRDREQELCEHIRRGICAFIATTRTGLPNITLVEFLSKHSLTMVHLATTYIDRRKASGPMRYLDSFAEAISACMLAIGEDSWRTAVVLFQTSENSFALRAWPLPKEADNIADMGMSISWNDPEPHEVKLTIKGWNKRKVGLTFVVDRSGVFKEEIRQLTK